MNYVVRIACVVALGFSFSSCGDGAESVGTLPPIATTTTTTTIPSTTTTLPDFYVIQAGDSLSSIATQFGVSAADLQTLNEISNPDKIYSGLKLRLPQPGVVIPTTTAVFSFDTTPITP